ncbi:MAG: TGS domain-containing protein, partial [Bacillota bacterium]
MVSTIFPDGSRRDFPDGTTAGGVLKELGQRLQKEALVARVDGRVVDLATPLPQEAKIEFLTFADDD